MTYEEGQAKIGELLQEMVREERERLKAEVLALLTKAFNGTFTHAQMVDAITEL